MYLNCMDYSLGEIHQTLPNYVPERNLTAIEGDLGGSRSWADLGDSLGKLYSMNSCHVLDRSADSRVNCFQNSDLEAEAVHIDIWKHC